MNLNTRPSPLMSGLVRSALWDNYATQKGMAARRQVNTMRGFSDGPPRIYNMDILTNDSQISGPDPAFYGWRDGWKTATQSPVMLGGFQTNSGVPSYNDDIVTSRQQIPNPIDPVQGFQDGWKMINMSPVSLGRALGNTLGDASTDASSTDTGSSIGNLIQQGILAWNTQTITQANAQRLAQGLPALDPSAYAPQVNVGVSSSTIMMAALAIGAVFLLAGRR